MKFCKNSSISNFGQIHIFYLLERQVYANSKDQAQGPVVQSILNVLVKRSTR